MDITLTPIAPDKVAELHQLSVTTFKDTFGQFNTAANMHRYLTTTLAEHQLAKELADPESHFYFIEADGRRAGFLKVNVGAAQSDQVTENALEVERLYLLPKFQHHGIGSQVLASTEVMAHQWYKQAIWLGVWEHNEPAKAAYEKAGFTRMGEHRFTLGDDPQTDFIMVKSLV